MKRVFQQIFNWEKWPYDVLYFPISFYWLWCGIKARHFWFFTPVNPTLVFAGFEGGSKKEMYEQLPRWSYPTTQSVNPQEDITSVKQRMKDAALEFPVVVKPDTGMWGVLFRIIKNEEELANYHAKVGEPYILQTFVHTSLEFSVFHIRYPGQEKGIITGLIVKDYLHITGDGKKTVAELVALHPQAKYKTEEMQKKHEDNWQLVVPNGDKYFLSMSGNHIRGAKFINLNHEIDQRLCDVFDKISLEAGQFYFGRYDLKCTSLEDLKNGKNIDILEFNGAGAAITHIFDRGMGYFSALREIVRHWRHLYKIGKINHSNGVPYWGFRKGWRFMQNAKKNFKRLQAIDKQII